MTGYPSMAAELIFPPLGEMLRHGIPPVLATAVALWVDARSSDLFPTHAPLRPATGPRWLVGPSPRIPRPVGLDHPLRRALAIGLLAVALWLAVLSALAQIEPPTPEEVASLGLLEILLGPLILLAAALGWSWLAHGGGVRAAGPGNETFAALGLVTRRPGKEVGIGLVAGLAAWASVLAAAVVAAVALGLLGVADDLSNEPASLVVGMAGLPVLWRLALSLAAGVGEEIFFRGLLQPRIGLWASTLLFAIGHVGYGQPFLLLGVTLLSLIYGLLAAWRGSVWAAIVAHALFDAIQLLWVIPLTLEGLGDSTVTAFWVGAGFW